MSREKNLGELLLQSLHDAVAFEEGRLEARVSIRELTVREAKVDTPPRYGNERVRATRLKLGYSQPIFAKALNVSTQTVKAWEQGTRVPDGPTRRLLEIAEEAPEILQRKVHLHAKSDAN
jgi:putative transcriptional regulator